MFERRGVVTVELKETSPSSREALELFAIEAGAEDLYWHDNALDLYADPSALASIREKLQEKGLEAASSLDWVPKEHIRISEEDQAAAERLFEALDDQEDVQDIYSNL